MRIFIFLIYFISFEVIATSGTQRIQRNREQRRLQFCNANCNMCEHRALKVNLVTITHPVNIPNACIRRGCCSLASIKSSVVTCTPDGENMLCSRVNAGADNSEREAELLHTPSSSSTPASASGSTNR